MNAHEPDLLQRVDPIDRKLTCERCGSVEQPRFTKAGPHIKAECTNCGAYIKFVRQLSPTGRIIEHKIPLQNIPGNPIVDAMEKSPPWE